VSGNLSVNGDRLWDSILETARIGGTGKGGICRLTLTDEDRAVRDWFVQACRDAGCSVTVDEMGNIFARRPGRDDSLPPIAIGSHLDTQPTGGKFDGVIGVLAGLEALRTLNDAGIQTNAPIEVIDWTNEEGSRFAPSMLASGVFAGVFPVAEAHARQDRQGLRLGDELARIGYRGEAPCGGRRLAAHFELHIEQGPILEAEEKTIGIVTGVQAIRWYELTVTGRESHAGTTPIPRRQDALLAAARMVVAVRAAALAAGPDAVSTVGLLECRPNSRNVVPGSVFLTVDLRHPDDAQLAALEARVEAACREIAAADGVALDFACIWASPAVHFDPACIAAVEAAAAARNLPARRIVSGAGHDSAYIARVAPTTMIFVPCAGGLSHNEAESATQSDITAGANVLLAAILATDSKNS
jgi:N-carbamoyl-L-amino-acid hydrolase